MAAIEVLSASNGLEALAICRRSSPPIDLLITDYNMPGMKGWSSRVNARRLDADLPVLHISGSFPEPEVCAEMAQPEKAAFCPSHSARKSYCANAKRCC